MLSIWSWFRFIAEMSVRFKIFILKTMYTISRELQTHANLNVFGHNGGVTERNP